MHVVGKGGSKKRKVGNEIGKNEVGKFEPLIINLDENFLTSDFPI